MKHPKHNGYARAAVALIALVLFATPAAGQTRPATNPAAAAPRLAMALEELTKAKPVEETLLPLIVAAELAADAGDRATVIEVLHRVEANPGLFWPRNRWAGDVLRFGVLPTSCIRVDDRAAADRALGLLAEALRGRDANEFANAWVGLATAYAAADDVTAAIDTAVALPDPLDRTRALASASAAARRFGHVETAERLRDEARSAADRVTDRWDRQQKSPYQLALWATDSGDADLAMSETAKHDNLYARSLGYSRLARRCALAGDSARWAKAIAPAEADADRVQDVRMHNVLRVQIAHACLAAGDRRRAIENLQKSRDALPSGKPFDHWWAGFYLAGWFARAGDEAAALSLLKECERLATEGLPGGPAAMHDPEVGLETHYRFVIFGFADAGNTPVAEALLAPIRNPDTLAEAAGYLAAAYGAADRPADAAAALKRVPYDPNEMIQIDRPMAVRRAAFGLAGSLAADELRAWIAALPNASDRAWAALGAAERFIRGRFEDYDPI